MSKYILNQLGQLQGANYGSPVHVEPYLKALDEVGGLGTPFDVQYIARYLFSENPLIAERAAKNICKLLSRIKEKKLWLELYKSRFNSYEYNPFDKNKLSKIPKFPLLESVHAYGVASLNCNGYVREEALDYLGNLPTSAILPYILIRLNDWVPEVADKAKVILLNTLLSTSIIEIIKYSRLVDWLNKVERVNLTTIRTAIINKLTAQENREELFLAMETADFKQRLFCWEALEQEVISSKSLIDRAIHDPAAEVRQWAASHLPFTKEHKERFRILFFDKAVRVRYAALKSLSESCYDEYREFIELAIFDDSRLVRHYARHILREYNETNLAAKYREKILQQKGKVSLGVILGIAEVGEKKDIKVLSCYLNHKNAKARIAAFKALHRLEADNMAPAYMLGMQDVNKKVRNTCIAILHQGHEQVRLELESFLEKPNSKTQEAALYILTQHRLIGFSSINSLRYILLALTLPSESLKIKAWQYLVDWCQCYGTQPFLNWFNFNSTIYSQTEELLAKLQKQVVVPTDNRICYAWQELPIILRDFKHKNRSYVRPFRA